MFIIYRSEEAVVPLAEAWECADEPLRAAILRATYDIDRRLAEAPRRHFEVALDIRSVLVEVAKRDS
jgi:hypothetical protein